MCKQLQDMALFTMVAECGSFTGAAKRCGLPKSSVSQHISHLEQTLGVRLINRTTRQLNLTFVGERYLVHCQEMLRASERANQAIHRLQDNLSGRLRITSSSGMGSTLLAQLNAAFLQAYPDVTLEVSVADEGRNWLSDGDDMALCTRQPQDPSLVGRRIGYCERLLVASQDYLAQHEEIVHPWQLTAHRCIVHRIWSEWLLNKGKEYYRCLPSPGHITDNLYYARECALADAGITLLPRFLTEERSLVAVLAEWTVTGNELWLVYPSGKLHSPALSRFVDYVMQSPLLREFYR